MMWCLSDHLVPGCPKGVFLIHSDSKSQSKFGLRHWVLWHNTAWKYTLLYRILCAENKSKKVEKAIDFMIKTQFRVFINWIFTPEFTIFMFSLPPKNPSHEIIEIYLSPESLPVEDSISLALYSICSPTCSKVHCSFDRGHEN